MLFLRPLVLTLFLGCLSSNAHAFAKVDESTFWQEYRQAQPATAETLKALETYACESRAPATTQPPLGPRGMARLEDQVRLVNGRNSASQRLYFTLTAVAVEDQRRVLQVTRCLVRDIPAGKEAALLRSSDSRPVEFRYGGYWRRVTLRQGDKTPRVTYFPQNGYFPDEVPILLFYGCPSAPGAADPSVVRCQPIGLNLAADGEFGAAMKKYLEDQHGGYRAAYGNARTVGIDYFGVLPAGHGYRVIGRIWGNSRQDWKFIDAYGSPRDLDAPSWEWGAMLPDSLDMIQTGDSLQGDGVVSRMNAALFYRIDEADLIRNVGEVITRFLGRNANHEVLLRAPKVLP